MLIAYDNLTGALTESMSVLFVYWKSFMGYGLHLMNGIDFQLKHAYVTRYCGYGVKKGIIE